jgi:hypothetical protein
MSTFSRPTPAHLAIVHSFSRFCEPFSFFHFELFNFRTTGRLLICFLGP